jgi:2-polyprenyl-6-methoxyphenol hydroxylase-like FAD-dependent oxidoreductase
MNGTQGRHAEIAGGGIAGLTMACCLARRGWSVTVHERNRELREMGAALYLKVNSLAVLKELGLLPAAREVGERLLNGRIQDERGRVLLSRVLPADEEAIVMLRPELHRILAACARDAGVEVLTSSEVVRADPAGAVELKTGAIRRADLVVGADGHRSPVRESLGLTRSLEEVEEGAIRVLAPRLPGERAGTSVEHWSGDLRLGLVPCSVDQLYVFLIGPHKYAGVRSLPIDKAFWSRRFPHLADVLERIPADAGRYDRLMLGKVHAWSSGRAAIIGDAAHTQPPNLGQGAGMSMANAAALARQLDASDDVLAALRQWEADRRPVSETVQRWSYRYGLLGYGLPARLSRLRSAFVWTAGRIGPTARGWGWVWRGGHHAGEIRTL